jgi:5-methyltetrahydrofolate--homocysteine methyltransferase
LVTLQEARANAAKVSFDHYTPAKPKFMGRRVFKNFDLAELEKYIDWGPFFQTWDLAGPFPAILNDEVVGVEAKKVFADGQAMLKKIIEGRWLTANAVVGLFPAQRVGDDIVLYADETRQQQVMTWHGLRQQTVKPSRDKIQNPNRCLSDYVADQTQAADYVGLFAVTTGIGSEKQEKRFVDAHDDYSAILFKALADRLAEAFAECMHHRVRTDLWGYVANEALSNEELIQEKYQGIRPAPGYPACPDHSAKLAMFDVLQCDDIGMGLTSSLAMTPAASVSGFYLAHPEAQYFNVGRIGEDQVQDLAQRQGVAQKELERLLAPNL